MNSSDFVKKYLNKGSYADKEKSSKESGTAKQPQKAAGRTTAHDFVSKYTNDEYLAAQNWRQSASRLINDVQKYYSTWQSKDDERHDQYQKQADALISQSDYWRKKYATDKDALTSVLSIENALAGIKDYSTRGRDYYSRWNTAEEYEKQLAAQKDYDEKSLFDIGSGREEIAQMEADYEKHKEVSDWYREYMSTTIVPDTDDPTISANIARYKDLTDKYGSYSDLEAAITQKKQYLNHAKRIQDGIALSGVTQNADFGENSAYVSTKTDDRWKKMSSQFGMGYGDLTYEYINGKENGLRQEIINKAVAFDAKTDDFFAYDYMTEEQINIYNYHYAKEGKEAADKYLDSIREALNYQEATERFSKMEDKTAVELLFGIEAGVDQFQSGMKNVFNTEDDYIAQTAIQMASGMVREDLADAGAKLPDWMGGASVGQVGYDAITTTTNMLPSIMTSTVMNFMLPGSGAVAGTAMMGASAAGNAYQEMLNLGYDKGQARVYSTLVGASEAGLQYLLGGIGKLGGKLSGKAMTNILNGIDNAFARTAIKLGGNMLSEGFEEGLQEILTPWFKSLVMHTNESINWGEVAYSTLLGALTAGVMEGVDIVSGESNIYRTGKQIQAADISAERLADIGKTFSADTVAYQLAGRVNENTGAYTIGRLFNEIGATLTEQNVTEITGALVAKGMDEATAKKNAKALAYVVEGGNLTDKQVAAIEANEVLAEAARTTLVDANTTWNQRAQGYNEALKALTDETAAKNASRTNPAKQSGENQTSIDTEDTIGESGTEANAEADVSPVKVQRIASIENGNATVRLEDGTEVSAKDADLDPDEGIRIETIASIDGISSADANFILHTLRLSSNHSAQMDALGAKEAYKYGFYGFSQEHIAKHGVFANTLTESQRQAIYNTGREASQRKAEAKQATVWKNRTVEKTGKVHFEGNREALTERQSASLSALEKVAEALGVQIHVFESAVNEEGKHTGANGWYDPKTGSIHIDLHAGVKGEATMLFTAAHELTHFIRQWSPAKFKILADFLMEEYGKKNVNMDALVREQIAKAKRNGRTISYDTAYEEVVADSMETMLSDGKVLEKLAKLKAKDKTLWQKIKDYISDLAAKIRSVYDGLSPDSVEGRHVAEMVDAIEKLQDMFAEALVDAGDNYQTAEKNTTQEGGAVQYSLREFEDGRRFVDVQMDAHVFDGMSVAQMNRAVKPILMEKFAGKVIGVDNPVFVNGDSVNEYLHPSKSIDTDTRKAKLTAAGELDNLLDAGSALPDKPDGEDGHVHPDTTSFSYLQTIFKVGDEYFEGVVNIKNNRRGKLLKDITKIKNITEDIVSSYGKNPKSNFLRDASMDSIRSTAGNVKQESEKTLMDAGVSVNDETDSGSLFSVRDVLDDTTRGKVANALASRFNVTEKEAMEWLSAETSLASLILNPKYSSFLDYEADPNEVAIKQNSDYPQGTVDFSNICKKRREFTQVMNRILRNFPNHVFAATDLAKIRTIMGEEGMTLPCGICYVEDRRQLDTIVAQDFIDGLKLYREGSKTRPDGKPFNANQLKGLQLTDGDTYVPTIYELVSLEGRNSLKAKNPNMEAAWVRYNNARGMQAVRLLTNEAEYKRQILKYSPKTVKSKNDHGGLRIYSFSDAEMFHLIDIIQVITDSAAVGLYLQGYTKVNEYAKAVKDTGEKLNRSLIPKGDLGYHIEDGKVVLDYDTVEGIDIYSEDFFDNKDNPDVGNITIGINDVQIRAAMVSDFVDQIIPFHTGQSKEVLGEKGIAAWQNYENYQKEKDLATGNNVSNNVNIYTEVIQAAEAEGKPIQNKRQFVEKFLQVCKENGLQPRFAQFLNVDGAGNYVYTEGYHKFLVDFKTFAQTEVGEYLPQGPVKPIFDNAYITGLLKAYVKEQQVKDAEVAKQMPKVIERITNEIVKPEEAKFSGRDYSYKALTSKPDMKVTTVGGAVPKNRADVIYMAKKNATSVGRFDPYTGSVSVHVADIGRDVVLGTVGLKHGLEGRREDNAIVTLKAGEILHNSIRINELTPKKDNADGSYVLIGAARGSNGDLYIVRSVVNTFKHELVSMDVLYAINAKKRNRLRSMRPGFQGPVTDSTISIAELLDLVNEFFPDILPEDVLKHYGYDARPDGNLGADALYSERDTESVSNRSLLANAFVGLAQNEIERNKMQEYKEKLSGIEAQERKLRELNEQIKALSFAKGPRDKEKLRTLRDEATKTANRISIYDQQLLRLEASTPLQNVLEREKKKAYQRAEQRGKEALEEYREKTTKRQQELMDKWQESRKKAAEKRDGASSISYPDVNESVGAAPAGFDPITHLQYEYGTIPGGENPVRDDSLPVSTDGKNKVSWTARTVKGAGATPDEFADLIDAEVAAGGLSYLPVSNGKATENASKVIEEEGWETAKANWHAAVRAGKVNAEMSAMGALLLNNAAKAGDRKAWLEILADYQIMGTGAAQAVQALRILKTLTPTDRLYMLRRSINKMVRDLGLEDEVEIDQTLVDEYNAAETEEQRDAIITKIQKDVAAQLPSTGMEMWTALRYVNMLGNFKTQGRNILGNISMALTTEAKNTVAASLEMLVNKATRGRLKRTKSLTVNKDLLKACMADFKEVESLALDGGKFQDAATSRLLKGIRDKKRVFKAPKSIKNPEVRNRIDTALIPMEKYRRITNWAMEQGDLLFSKWGYARALAGYLEANGVTGTELSKVDEALLDEARTYAIQEAQEATFRDHNALTEILASGGPGNGKLQRAVYAAGQGILPFRQTPANVLLRAEEYSPLGFINAIAQAVQAYKGDSNVSGTKIINSFAKALTGTGLFFLGMMFANLNWARGGPEEDDNKEAFDALNGEQNYSLTISGESYTFDWLAPVAIPFFMGVNLKETADREGLSLETIKGAFLSLTDPMLQMSMLQGLNDTLGEIRYSDNGLLELGMNALTDYALQGMTNSLLSQLERGFEQHRMTTFRDKSKGISADTQYTLGNMSAKIPGWEYSQIPYINAWGEEEESLPAYWNIPYNLLSPSYYSEETRDTVAEELYRLHEVQSDVNVFPRRPEKELNYMDTDGVTHSGYNLSADEYVALAKAQGQTQRKLVEDILGSEYYEGLTDKQKATAIDYAYTYAKESARGEVITGYADDYGSFSAKWMYEIQGDPAEAILRKVATGTTEKWTGLEIDTALHVTEILETIQPESGYTNVRSVQRMETVMADQKMTVDEKMIALKEIMGEELTEKYDTAQKLGVSADSFVKAYRKYQDTKGSGKKQTLTSYYARFYGLSEAKAEALYDLFAGRK